MQLSLRIRNFVSLVRSGNFRYLTSYYLDRIRVHPATAAYTVALDVRYARRLLGGDLPSRFGRLGAQAVHHTSYAILNLIFAVAKPRTDDVLVDVGCGKGRVVIYWLHRNYGRRIVGLEIDPDIAARTARQFRRFPNVEIIPGDAIINIPNDGTFFYLYNPFTEEKVVEFESRIAALPSRGHIRVIYYNPNFLEVFRTDRWARRVVQLNGVLDRGTLKRFCFPVAILDRIHAVAGDGSDERR